MHRHSSLEKYQYFSNVIATKDLVEAKYLTLPASLPFAERTNILSSCSWKPILFTLGSKVQNVPLSIKKRGGMWKEVGMFSADIELCR